MVTGTTLKLPHTDHIPIPFHSLSVPDPHLASMEQAFQLLVFVIARWVDDFVGSRFPANVVHHLFETGEESQDNNNDYRCSQCQDIFTYSNGHPH